MRAPLRARPRIMLDSAMFGSCNVDVDLLPDQVEPELKVITAQISVEAPVIPTRVHTWEAKECESTGMFVPTPPPNALTLRAAIPCELALAASLDRAAHATAYVARVIYPVVRVG